MTTIDWKALRPHVPLGPHDAQYVERAGSAGEEIAQWVSAGRSTLLVGGPAGVGKSTELAHAAARLSADRVACLVQLDRVENMRRLTPDLLSWRLAAALVSAATRAYELPVSEELRGALAFAGVLGDRTASQNLVRFDRGDVALDAAIAEVSRLASPRPITLLIDGLEKVPQGVEGLELFDALGSLPEEVELVVVIPWHAAFGPQADTVIRGGESFIAARAIDVEGPTAEPGRAFLRRVLAERLGLEGEAIDEAKRALVDDAIQWSGGVPRTFLQLMAGAGLYAVRRRKDPWPSQEDMADARADHIESVGRLFTPGDKAAIRSVVGTTGRELDLERKVRLMAHGILLERVREGVATLALHPLAKAALAPGGKRA